jgi:hypothetical protein
MNISLQEIDRQIQQIENRIAVERVALDDAMHGCTNSLREAVTSPKTLLAVLGVGYAVGKILFRDKPEPKKAEVAKKAGVLGMLTGVAGTAISLAGSRWGTIAKWAAGRYFARKKAAGGAAPRAAARPAPSSPSYTAPRTTPAYTRTPPTSTVSPSGAASAVSPTGATSTPRPISAREL